MQLIFGDVGSGEHEVEVEEEDAKSANLVGLATSLMERRHNIGKKKVFLVLGLAVLPVLLLEW